MISQPMKIPLHDYQIYAKDFAKSHPFCGLFLEMGLGKTSIILEMLWELNPTEHVLIIAPKTIARCTWQNEIDKWGINIRTQSLIVNERGKQLTKKKREEIYDSIPSNPDATVYFINREMVSNLTKYFPGKKWPFKIVIIDESQSFKSYSSDRFKAMKSVRPYIERLVLLTGSPTPKGPMDLWSQIYLLDEGKRLGKYITRYRESFFNPGLMVNGHPVDWTPKPFMQWPTGYPIYIDENTGNLLHQSIDIRRYITRYQTPDERSKVHPASATDVIYSNISDLVISMKNRYIVLPPVTYVSHDIILDSEEKDRYKKFMKDSILELKDGTQIEAANAAVLSAKLSQMASGAIYTDPKTHKYEIVHEHKLEMCEYIINNTDSPVIIAYHFRSDMEMLMRYLPEHDINPVVFDGTPEMERSWNRKEIPVMLVQPASCGFGLNFQEGGHTLIWYTIPWSLEEYEQTNARIYRQGQTEPVIIHHLMTKGTIDKHILKAIETKSVTQQALLNAVEATLEDSDIN